MQVNFQGRPWELDLSDINVKPAMVIQGFTGLSVSDWVDSLTSEADEQGNLIRDVSKDPEFLKSLIGVYWLMLQQNGTVCPIADVDFPVGAFSSALGEAFAAEAAALATQAAAEPEPDPTLTPGSPSASSQEPVSTPPMSPLIPGAEGSPDG